MVQNEAKRRGRPRGFDPDQALDRARDAFWDTGFAATSLDALAAATGLNRPSLYLAFGDKRALFRRTLDRYGAATLQSLAEALLPEQSARDGVAEMYRRAIATYLAGPTGPRGCLLISAAVPEAAEDAALRGWLREMLDAIDAAFAARLRQARDDGEMAPGSDPVALGRLAASVMFALSVRARAGAPRAELDSLAAAGLGALFGTPPPGPPDRL
jgi:AcrR family transcriptional regulator